MGGIAIIAAVALMLFLILNVCLPLFKPASVAPWGEPLQLTSPHELKRARNLQSKLLA